MNGLQKLTARKIGLAQLSPQLAIGWDNVSDFQQLIDILLEVSVKF